MFPTDMEGLYDFFRKALAFSIGAQKARKSTKTVFEFFRDKFYDLGIYVFKDSFRDNSISGLYIVAKGKYLNATIVTAEGYKPNSAQIPNLCEATGINYIGYDDFMEIVSNSIEAN